jgi:hypothetical protein
MGTKTVAVENVFFKPMQFLYDTINSGISDPNQERANQVDPQSRQWIFPTTPEAIDENYPRVALIAGNMRFEEYGAGRFIETVTDQSGNWQSETRGVIAVLPVTIGVFVKKKQFFRVEDIDGSISTMQNTKLSDYIGYRIANLMVTARNAAIAKNMELKVSNITSSYEDNEFLYAKNVEIELMMFMAAETKFGDAGLIKHIDLSVTVNLTN